MNWRKNFIFLTGFTLILILNSGCEHISKEKSSQTNFVYKKTQHGIINFQKKEDLKGKTRSEILKILGPSILKCSSDESCEYYISSSSNHFYFKLPSVVEHVIYKICFDKFSKAKFIEIINKTNSNFQNHKFQKSLKNHESLSKSEVFKKIFESSEFKVK